MTNIPGFHPDWWPFSFDLGKPSTAKVQRKRRPTLASMKKQAAKAGIEVARYEIKPDGTAVYVPGTSESSEPNPWLADLQRKETQ
jgi:hypothetical protein